MHYCSINLNCCRNTWEFLILTIKKNLSNGQLWKISKETALIELCPLFIDILAFELSKLCFFDPGGGGVLH